MNIIQTGSLVKHDDDRKGEVVEIKADRARVKWLIKPDGTNYITGNTAYMSDRIKRTWVKLSVLHLISS